MRPVVFLAVAIAVLAQPALAADSSDSGEMPEPPGHAGSWLIPKDWLSYESRDRNLELKLGGRLQEDGAVFWSDKTQLSDGAKARRGRISLGARFFRDWGLAYSYDFAASGFGIKNLYLRYTGFSPITVTAGQFKEPASLDAQTSSKYLTFLERALPNEFVPSEHLGIEVGAHGANWTAATGLFGQTADTNIDTGGEWGISGRATYAPVSRDGDAVHFGASVIYQATDSASKTVRFNPRPETHIPDVRFADTHTIHHAENYIAVGPEAAIVTGPFSLQGEYLHAFVNREQDRGHFDFDGWYGFASYFLTGESRNYAAAKGGFGRVTPNRDFDFDGGLGAWEVAARVSQIDLNDGSIHGGRERDVTIGLNWYPNSYLRFMADYILVETDANATGARNHGAESPHILALRAQIEF